MFNDNRPTRFGGFIEMKDELLMDAPTLTERLAQVERERDASVADLSDSCRHCRFIKQEEDSPCADCFQRDGKYPWSPMVRTKFEWRGVCKENTKEDGSDERKPD